MKTATLNLYSHYQGRAFAALCAVCVLSVFCYGALLLLAVAHTAKRTAAERQIAELRVAISEFEARYLAEVKELSPERAAALGFISPEASSVVYADASRALYTLR